MHCMDTYLKNKTKVFNKSGIKFMRHSCFLFNMLMNEITTTKGSMKTEVKLVSSIKALAFHPN